MTSRRFKKTQKSKETAHLRGFLLVRARHGASSCRAPMRVEVGACSRGTKGSAAPKRPRHASQSIPLCEVRCLSARPDLTEKSRKLVDGGELILLISPAGAKHWRCKYRFGGREKLLAVGPYPSIALLMRVSPATRLDSSRAHPWIQPLRAEPARSRRRPRHPTHWRPSAASGIRSSREGWQAVTPSSG